MEAFAAVYPRNIFFKNKNEQNIIFVQRLNLRPKTQL
jgi:hypothetical protein